LPQHKKVTVPQITNAKIPAIFGNLLSIRQAMVMLSFVSSPPNQKSLGYDTGITVSRVQLVLGETAPRTVKEEVAVDTTAPPWDAPVAKAPEVAVSAAATAEASDEGGDDDAFSYFQKLANAD
jgi:hypothetical protein